MYNLREEAKNFHVKGRGNGYVLEKDGMRVYFSGDTEDIPEVYPYHYRGRPEVSDVKQFAALVKEGNPKIRVVQLDWYPGEDY